VDGVDDYLQPTSILCYSCTLIESIHEERDHYQGPLGCADPFDPTDIPRVECDGECGVRTRLHDRADVEQLARVF